jgi:hypothetical protein
MAPLLLRMAGGWQRLFLVFFLADIPYIREKKITFVPVILTSFLSLIAVFLNKP